ncbi:MAG: adenylyl-sulfate kinase [Nocardioidaceae bacterium]
MTLPQWTPTARELADLELLTFGVLAPANGFDQSVRLTLPADQASTASEAGGLELIDPEGVPLATLAVRECYDAGDGRVGLIGPVSALSHGEFGPFRRLHRRPADVRADRRDAFAVVVRDPLTRSDVAAVETHAAATGRTPLLLVFTGPGGSLTLSAPGLVRATLAAAAAIGDCDVVAVAASDGTDPTVVCQAFADDVLVVPGTGELAPGVAAIRDRDRPPRDRQGLVVFFTGLSGSGKSTLARALTDLLLERGDRTVTSLDGDVVRHHLSRGLGFSRADREANIERIGWVAAEISRHGGVAICSPIAPFDETRHRVRDLVDRAGGGFVLVHVATPLEECERRDRKGLYAKARAGLIPEFTGISSPYEEPADSRVRVDTTGRTVEDALGEVVNVLYEDGWLRRESSPRA